MAAIVVVCLTSCCISEVATASRQLWCLARDNGLPGSTWIAHVAPGWNLPLRAVLVSFLITSLLACTSLGSATALDAINFPWRRFCTELLLCNYCLSILEATLRPTAASSSLVARSMGSRRQRCGALLPDAALVLFFLAPSAACYRGEHGMY